MSHCTQKNSPGFADAGRMSAMVILLCLSTAVNSAEARESPAPNVLFISIDDLNMDVGCYGRPIVQTPNIDRLAKRGMRFDRAYCQYPVCNPSRVSMLSGLYPSTNGVLRLHTPVRAKLPDMVTLPQQFRRHGYTLRSIGKIFHQPDPPTFDEGAASPKPVGPEVWDPWMEPPFGRYHESIKRINELTATTANKEKRPDYRIASEAVEFLRSASRDQPFFLAVGFHLPHVPLIAPKEYIELYDATKVELPADFRAMPGSPRDTVTTHAFRPNIDLFYQMAATEDAARQTIAAYYACTSFMDAQVGRVLDELDQQRLADNTVIVFVSDHGFHLGEKGLWAKMTLFERSAQVPLLIVVPGMEGRRSCARVVELTDLYPTLTQLCGLPTPQNLDGQSLTPLLNDPTATWNKPAITMLLRHERLAVSVRTERWRYTEWDEGRRGIELYDHDADPSESNNLAESSEHADVRNRLSRRLRESLNRTP